MAEKREPLNATFFAFRRRERSGVLLGASAAFVVSMIVLFLLAGAGIVFSIPGGFGALANAFPTPEQMASGAPPAISFGALAPLILIYFAVLFVMFILMAAYEAACLRWMIHGESGGFFGLSFGDDTWRVYGTYWMWLVVSVGYFVGAFMSLGVISVVADVAGLPEGAVAGIVGLLALLICLAPIYWGVRFAPAAATSIGRKNFAFFKAWTVTKGRFWPMFGSFLVLWILYLLVALFISGATYMLLFGPALAEMIHAAQTQGPEAASEALNAAVFRQLAAQYANPLWLASYFVVQVIGWSVVLVFYVLLYGVNARAVRAALDEGRISIDDAGSAPLPPTPQATAT